MSRDSKWRIYYDDGSIFTSEDGSWEDAPLDGVLFVLQKVGDRVITQSGGDYYLQVEGDIVETMNLDPLLRKLRFVKFGRWTSIRKYEKVSAQVAKDAATW